MVGFVENTKEDFVTLYNAVKHGVPTNEKNKVTLAGIRTVGLLMSSVNALWFLRIMAQGVMSEGQGVIKLACAVSGVVFGYDLFRIGENIGAQLGNKLATTATGIKAAISVVSTAVRGGSPADAKEEAKRVAAKDLSERTALQPLWVATHKVWLGPVIERFTGVQIN